MSQPPNNNIIRILSALLLYPILWFPVFYSVYHSVYGSPVLLAVQTKEGAAENEEKSAELFRRFAEDAQLVTFCLSLSVR